MIGAGQAGLATAHHLLHTGFTPTLLDASERPGGAWPRYYDSLTLFSPARFSALPGRPFPGDPDAYPTRDEVVAYLTAYANAIDTDIRYGHRVQSLTQTRSGFAAIGDGFSLEAPLVVVASGSFGRPILPDVPGLASFAGRTLHAAEYTSANGFAGQRIAIVGAGNSAIQIAHELAAASDVTVFTRRAIRWQRQRLFGRDLHWWLVHTGLDSASKLRTLLPQSLPVVDDGRYRDAFRKGHIHHEPMFRAMEGHQLVLADGSEQAFDAVIFATGYGPDVPFLKGTSALDAADTPLHRNGVSTTMRGLGYVGLEHQRSLASATLRGAGSDALMVIEALMADLSKTNRHSGRQ